MDFKKILKHPFSPIAGVILIQLGLSLFYAVSALGGQRLAVKLTLLTLIAPLVYGTWALVALIKHRRIGKAHAVVFLFMIFNDFYVLSWSEDTRFGMLNMFAFPRFKKVAMALEAYEKDNGHPPASLGQLKPDYVDAIPRVTVFGDSFKYDPAIGKQSLGYEPYCVSEVRMEFLGVRRE